MTTPAAPRGGTWSGVTLTTAGIAGADDDPLAPEPVNLTGAPLPRQHR